MIIYRVHGVIGHSTNEDVLIADADCHKEFIDRLQKLMVKLRTDYPDTEIAAAVTEDVSIEALKRCAACGDRDVTRI